MKQKIFIIYLLICLFSIGCTSEENPVTRTQQHTIVADEVVPKQKKSSADLLINDSIPKPPIDAIEPESPTTVIKPTIETTQNIYSWTNSYQIETALVHQIAVPTGYKRTKVVKGSFADWLRHLPLKPQGSKVLYFNGAEKTNQSIHKAVLDIDVGKRDLQQCADAVMRLKAEYHYSKKEMEAIHFNYTSGHKVAFSDWSKGRKPIVKGNKVLFSNANGRVNTSYKNFKKYLNSIFNYAGTASLSKELKPKSVQNIEIGNVFIQGGFPGHAVLVVDMAKNEAGEKIFLIAQSYMPAQSIHILKNLDGNLNGVWYKIPSNTNFPTPEWNFEANDLMTF